MRHGRRFMIKVVAAVISRMAPKCEGVTRSVSTLPDEGGRATSKTFREEGKSVKPPTYGTGHMRVRRDLDAKIIGMFSGEP
jgi:hypothetical protein